MADAPDQFIIVQDRNFVQSTKQSITTKESGMGGGIASASANNMGTLKCTTVGTFKSTSVDLDFRVQDSGSLGSTTWAWKASTDTSGPTSDVYYGEPDKRFSWNEQGVFGSNAGVGYAYSASGVYNEKLGRVICYRIKNATTIEYAYKDLDDSDYNGNEASWTTGDITVEGIDDFAIGNSSITQGAQMDACSMANGTYRMAIKFNDDIDIYYSDDGLNWTLFAERILSRFADERINFDGLKIASSGDFVKVTFVSSEKVKIKVNITGVPDEHNAEEVYDLDERLKSIGSSLASYSGKNSNTMQTVGLLESIYTYQLDVNLINSLISADLGATWRKKQVGSLDREVDLTYQLSVQQSISVPRQFDYVYEDGQSKWVIPDGIGVQNLTKDLLYWILGEEVYDDRPNPSQPLADIINEELATIPYCGRISNVGRDVYNYDCIGLDDTSGTFLISTYRFKSDVELAPPNTTFGVSFYQTTISNPVYEFVTYFSVGFSAYATITTLTKEFENSGSPRLFLCNGQNFIWAYFDNIKREQIAPASAGLASAITASSAPQVLGGSNPYLYNTEEAFYYFDKRSIITSAEWEEIGIYSSFEGCKRYRATKGKLFAIGDGFNLFAGLSDSELVMNAAYVPRNMYKRWGGWQTRPVSVNQLSNYREGVVIPYQPEGKFYDIEWTTLYGAPKGLYDSVFSPWEVERTTPSSTASVFVSWTPNRLRLDNGSATVEKFYYYKWIDYRSIFGGSAAYGGTLFKNDLDGGWVFAPSEDPAKGGSCIMWACKIHDDQSATKAPSVRITSYMPAIAANTNPKVPNGVVSQKFQVTVRMRTNQIIIYDPIGLTNRQVITLTGLDTNFFEFRLGIQPVINTSGTTSRTATMVLCYRKFGTETWSESSTFTINPATSNFAEFSTVQLFQGIEFGHIQNQKDSDSEWKYVRVHQGSDLNTFNLIDQKPDTIRGKLVSSNKTYIKYGIYNFWGGVGGAEGDLFDADVRYANSVTNATSQATPRVQFRSDRAPVGNVEDIILKAPTGKEFEMHTAFAVFKCNAQSVALAYSDDNVSYTTAGTIDMQANTFTVSSVSGKKMVGTFTNNVTRFQYNSDDNVVYYASIQSAHGSITQYETFEIVKHDDGSLVLDFDNSAASDLSSVPSSTEFKIYADRGYIRYNSAMSGSYVRVRLTNTKYSFEGVSILGSAVAGTYLDFTVPLDWAYVDKQQPNVTTYKTKGGVSWGYREGPPMRTIQANMIGDVSTQQRQQIRDLMNLENAFVVAPIVLILNHEARDYANFYDSRNIVLCRWVSGTDLKNDGWYYDSDASMWRPIGDMAITVEEIV